MELECKAAVSPGAALQSESLKRVKELHRHWMDGLGAGKVQKILSLTFPPRCWPWPCCQRSRQALDIRGGKAGRGFGAWARQHPTKRHERLGYRPERRELFARCPQFYQRMPRYPCRAKPPHSPSFPHPCPLPVALYTDATRWRYSQRKPRQPPVKAGIGCDKPSNRVAFFI